ncbi:MAG: PilZ domain-containing protein [Syntrophobacteraceae bacterium]
MDCFEDFEDDREYLSLREYARVTGYLPVSIRAVTETEKLSLVSRMVFESVSFETQSLPEIGDQALSACLKILNSKLDSIIRMLSFESCGKEMDMAKVNISDGGIRIHSPAGYEPNSDVEIKLIVPTAPSMIFYIYGKVVNCETVGDVYELCIEFTDIDDDIREHIAKYVFHKQRELIRKKRSHTP